MTTLTYSQDGGPTQTYVSELPAYGAQLDLIEAVNAQVDGPFTLDIWTTADTSGPADYRHVALV